MVRPARALALVLAAAAASCSAPPSIAPQEPAPSAPPASSAALPPKMESAVDRTKRAVGLARSGEVDEARALLDEILAKRPNVYTLHARFGLVDVLGPVPSVGALCKQVRPSARDELQILALLDLCMVTAHTTDPDVGLAWASPEDRDRYRKDRAERDAREERLHEVIDDELHDVTGHAHEKGDAGPPR
jgi:hypothetical protein